MSTMSPTESRPAATPAPSPLDAGPSFALPTLRIAGVIVGASAMVALTAWPIVHAVAPQAASSLPWVSAALAGAFLAALVAMRPWRPRATGRWMMAWLIHLGVAFLATLAAGGVLLYSAPSEGRPALGIALAAGHLIVLLAEALVVASRVRTGATLSTASSQAPSAPPNE